MILVAHSNLELEESNSVIPNLSSRLLNMTDSQIISDNSMNALKLEESLEKENDIIIETPSCEINSSSKCIENNISSTYKPNGNDHIENNVTVKDEKVFNDNSEDIFERLLNDDFYSDVIQNGTSSCEENNIEEIQNPLNSCAEKDNDTENVGNISNDNCESDKNYAKQANRMDESISKDCELGETRAKLDISADIQNVLNDNCELDKSHTEKDENIENVSNANCKLDKTHLEENKLLKDRVSLLDENSELEKITDSELFKKKKNCSLSDSVSNKEVNSMEFELSEQNSDEIKTEDVNESSDSIELKLEIEDEFESNGINGPKDEDSTPVLENDHMVYIATTDVFTELANNVSNAENSCIPNDVQDMDSEKDADMTIASEESITVEQKIDDVKKDSIIIDTLDLLLSDDENEPKTNEGERNGSIENKKEKPNRVGIQIEEDDDLLFIEDESSISKNNYNNLSKSALCDKSEKKCISNESDKCPGEISADVTSTNMVSKPIDSDKLLEKSSDIIKDSLDSNISKDIPRTSVENKKSVDADMNSSFSTAANNPIIPLNFMKTFKTSLSNMTRDDLEEYCVVKIVEAIVKKSDLSKAETKIAKVMKNNDALRKKIANLSKQQKDMEIVMKSLINEHKRRKNEIVEPVKISRSVGFQVGPNFIKSKTSNPQVINKNSRPVNSPDVSKLNSVSLPAPNKSNTQNVTINRINTVQRNVTDDPKSAKKDPQSSILKNTQSTNIVTENRQTAEKRPSDQSIDLTDDEPPAKKNTTNSKFKVTSPTNKIQSPSNFVSPIGNKVIMLNSSTRPPFNTGLQKALMYRPRNPSSNIGQVGKNVTITRPNFMPNQTSNVRIGIPIKNVPQFNATQSFTSITFNKHPAPLPIQRTNIPLKLLPPKPELKISKVPNGIVISWTMETTMDRQLSDIARYQIFAYQETTAPPHTDLWKKIGDVDALPLPMACTLTQFMAGYKYYFAVRAVDVCSRIGPFSLPGYILLNHEK